MSCFLCVDCGGSKTAAVIVDRAGKVVGAGYGGPSNLTYISSDDYTLAVKTAVTQALHAASLPSVLPPAETPFAAAWFGASGADSQAVIQSVLQPLSDLLSIPVGPRLTVTNDTNLLAAPIRFYNDVSNALSIIAGTGSIAVSFKDVGGQIKEMGRSGGWGWILGDEGGGFHVGREAIRAVLGSHDQASVTETPAPPSTLRDKILARFGITDVMESFRIVYYSDPAPGTAGLDNSPINNAREKRLSTLSPLVFEAAFEDGDPLALQVLKTCSNQLVSTASVLLGKPTTEKPRLVDPEDTVLTFGGSLVGIENYRDMVIQSFADRGYVFKHVLYVEDPAQTGAAALAATQKS